MKAFDCLTFSFVKITPGKDRISAFNQLVHPSRKIYPVKLEMPHS